MENAVYQAGYTLYAQDYRAALSAKHRAYPDRKKQLASAILILVLLLYVTPFARGEFTVMGVIVVVAMVALLLWLWAVPAVQEHRLTARLAAEEGDGEVFIFEDRVEFHKKSGEVYTILVTESQALLETPALFLVLRENESSILIPKRAFLDETDGMTVFFEKVFREKYHYISNSYFRFLPSKRA